jgi:hypothetical protein
LGGCCAVYFHDLSHVLLLRISDGKALCLNLFLNFPASGPPRPNWWWWAGGPTGALHPVFERLTVWLEH